MEEIKSGIIICGKYSICTGGKCFKAATDREESFSRKYYLTHKNLNTWNSEFLQNSGRPAMTDELTRLRYD